MSKYLVRASRKYFSKNTKSVDVVIMNVSGIFSHSSLVRTHEFSLKFRYNRFATPIGAGSAHASVHIHATCIHTPKYLFDFVPQGCIDYVRSSLVATLNFSVFGILKYHTWRYRTHRVQYRRKIYSKGNTRVIDFAVVDPKKKKYVSTNMISVSWLSWRLIFQRFFLASPRRKHIHIIALSLFKCMPRCFPFQRVRFASYIIT